MASKAMRPFLLSSVYETVVAGKHELLELKFKACGLAKLHISRALIKLLLSLTILCRQIGSILHCEDELHSKCEKNRSSLAFEVDGFVEINCSVDWIHSNHCIVTYGHSPVQIGNLKNNNNL